MPRLVLLVLGVLLLLAALGVNFTHWTSGARSCGVVGPAAGGGAT